MMKIVDLGLQDYEATWLAMKSFNEQRTSVTDDELWVVEHQPVYTLGLNGKSEHLLNTGEIPVVKCDRGGQVTYHGPGLLVIYTLFDVERLKLNTRSLVTLLEHAMINTIAQMGIEAVARVDAPGVYVEGQKIGSIGLRIKKQGCYHGLSLNNAMDLRPFNNINPCGYSGLKVTQLSDLGVMISYKSLSDSLTHAITSLL
jgi:lipoyl(octanoyl) transferase